MIRWVFLVACLSLASATDAQMSHVWWEGEATSKTSFPEQSWFSPHNDLEREKLSGGQWLSQDKKRQQGAAPAFAEYQINVPREDAYHLWARKFWKHGPFRWRFDEQTWQTCGPDVALADRQTLRTHVEANWVYLGQVKLDAGQRTFRIELLAEVGQEQTAAFDCFILTPGVFVPRGKLKPGESLSRAEEGYFAWEPGVDAFNPSPIDLRHLNEARAGMHGRLRADGEKLVRGDGQPIRLWGVNVNAENAGQNRASVDYLARKLAKLGVNAVRYHAPLFDASDVMKLDAKKLDDLHYLIHVMAQQGIYTKISFYFPLWFNVKSEYGIDGFETIENKRPFGLLYFDKRMQDIHRSWLDQLLTARNPYTGKSIGEDPAVAIIEIINEDSLLFWTFNKKNIPPVQWERLEVLFALSLGKKPGEVGLREAWFMTRKGYDSQSPKVQGELRQQVKFLVNLQRGFYEESVKFMRDRGYGGLVSASNWKTADEHTLGALERYTYMAGDLIDRHGYFGGRHDGEGAGYSVRVGHEYEDRAGVQHPLELPITDQQIAGFPHIISEVGWPNPNAYRGEATALGAAYLSLQGIDGIFWFSVGSNLLDDQQMTKFAVSDPATAWTFPACALIYRKSLVREGATVVRETLGLEELMAMKGSTAITAEALDQLRQGDGPVVAVESAGQVDPLSLYAGRVVRSIGQRGGASKIESRLESLISRPTHRVSSITDELRWNHKLGVLTINAPMVRGVVGFAKIGRVQLGDMSIESGNEFASVLVVSLDDQPLEQSRRILVQAFTRQQPYGFKAPGGRIADLGTAPTTVEKIELTLHLHSDRWQGVKVKALDCDGQAMDAKFDIAPTGPGEQRIRFSDGAMYHLIER